MQRETEIQAKVEINQSRCMSTADDELSNVNKIIDAIERDNEIIPHPAVTSALHDLHVSRSNLAETQREMRAAEKTFSQVREVNEVYVKRVAELYAGDRRAQEEYERQQRLLEEERQWLQRWTDTRREIDERIEKECEEKMHERLACMEREERARMHDEVREHVETARQQMLREVREYKDTLLKQAQERWRVMKR
eukprot:GHVU01000888.1.p1 GENE.GHVU01000888.1~~GHVU01000888.1.p1  ORF type:complete len:195 (-),score=21.75 GHVU01000888.1:249-833(-)